MGFAPRGSRRWLLELLLRFTMAYGILLYLSVQLPIFQSIEGAGVWLLNAGFGVSAKPSEARALDLLEKGDGSAFYVYEVRLGEHERRIDRRYHPHGYILLLFVALVLATPRLGWRRRVASLGVGAVLVFLLGLGLLMGDVQGWEQRAFVDIVDRPMDGPFGISMKWMRGLHRTAGAGLLPILLWSIYNSIDHKEQ